MSLFSRFTDRLSAATLATVGSNKGKGRILLLNTKATLRQEWAQYLGVHRSKPTMGAWIKFVSRYGVDMSRTDTPHSSTFTSEQMETMLEHVATYMIDNGMVEA